MLLSDGWWNRRTQSERAQLRRYVRFALLSDPFASEVEVDRLLASVPASAVEAFARHVIEGRPGVPPGF